MAMRNLYSERVADLRKEMKGRAIDCCIIFTADEQCSEYIDPHYKFREYVSGFTGSAGTLIVTMEEALLWTDGRYFIQAGIELEGSGIMLQRSGEDGVKDMQQYVRELAHSLKTEGGCFDVGVDLKTISVSSFDKLKRISDEEGCRITDIDLAGIIWKDRPDKICNPVYSLPVMKSGRRCRDKLKDIRNKLDMFKADSVIISGLSDVMWTFNIRGNDIEYNPVAVSYAYVDKEEAYLFLQKGCCPDELKEALSLEGVVVKDYDDFDDNIRRLKGRKVLADPATLNAHVFGLLEENVLIRRSSSDYIEKHIKNETECILAREWHIEDGLAVTRFIYKIKKLTREGVRINEYDAAMMLDDMRREICGNLGLSFETISAYAGNGAIIHYSPPVQGSAELYNEGFLLVDSGGQYEGATTDITRTIALGDLSREMKLDYTAVLKGVIDLADAVFLEGTRGENLDILARRPIWERFLDYRHGTGHGVGAQLNVHEGPQAFRYRIDKDHSQPKLLPGMITSDEPGVYLEGKYGIRIENLLLCVEKKSNEWGRFLGFDTLTLVPYERDAIIPDMLTVRQREIINEYHRTLYDLYSGRMEDDEREWLASVTAKI